MSIFQSVRLRVSWSVTFYFFKIFILWPRSSCRNGQVTSNMVPAHQHVTGVAVYPALLRIHENQFQPQNKDNRAKFLCAFFRHEVITQKTRHWRTDARNISHQRVSSGSNVGKQFDLFEQKPSCKSRAWTSRSVENVWLDYKPLLEAKASERTKWGYRTARGLLAQCAQILHVRWPFDDKRHPWNSRPIGYGKT